MASLKMQQFEQELLGHTAKVKELINKHITEDKYGDDAIEIKQQMLINVNNMFACAHTKVRKMNKTCAFLHKELDILQGKAPASERFTVKDMVESHESDE